MADEMVDYYEVLDIERDATDIEIRKAYNKKIAECKEKRRNGEHAEIKNVIKAYEVLLDKSQREDYNDRLDEYYERIMNKTSFDYYVDKVKEDYKYIKDMEEKNKFSVRREKREEYINREFKGDIDSIPKWIVFKTTRGILHVAGEFVYQLRKFVPKKRDDVTRYVIRNRKAIVGLALCGGLAIGLSQCNKKSVEPEVSVVDPVPPVEYITLDKIYEVQPKDTLSELAEKVGISMSDIEIENHLDVNLLYIGQKLALPYEVDESELYDYIKLVDVDDMSIKEIAAKYETNVETLEKLNEEYIVFDYDTQKLVSTTSTILVPDFSKIEKEKENYQYKKEN